MHSIAKVGTGIFIGMAVAWAFVHRRVIKNAMRGEPMPELPEWHKPWHP